MLIKNAIHASFKRSGTFYQEIIMKFSPQQEQAMAAIRTWYKSKDKYFTLAGYAGTGKTTLAKYIAEEIGEDEVIFCSYTGKAANVLREKGCARSGTIHSFLYKYVRDENDKPVFSLDVNTPLKYAKLVIVDEFSMLNDEIINHLNSLCQKILYLGDTFQLPPVSKQQTILVPEFFLEEIHRQALESPILRAATDVRLGKNIAFGDHGDFKYITRKQASNDTYLLADQVIVGRNDTRRRFNDLFRKLRGITSKERFDIGEKIICLKNNKANGLFNGMIGKVNRCVVNGPFDMTIDFDCDGELYNGLKSWRGDLMFTDADKRYDYKSGRERFDYAYAVTCHKCQGSEFDNVTVYREPVSSDPTERKRWTYTALTRARKTLTLIEP